MSRYELVETDAVKSAEGRPYSPALKIGDWLYVSGQVPLGRDGRTVSFEPEAQWRQALDNIKSLVEEAGARWRTWCAWMSSSPTSATT